jgi:hypothetical protein
MARPPTLRAASRRARFLVCALAALTAGCRCGEPPTERAFEVGAPLEDMPRASAGALASFVPAPAPVFIISERPAALLAQMALAPRLKPLADPRVLADLALSNPGATARAVRQRLNELSRLPTGVEATALLDGPFALAAREGPGDPDILLLKRLSPAAAASWHAARMLQAVHPSHNEVRAERYRGLPLRKVLVDEKRRLTYALLRDLLVAGTSDTWVKQSLDLALGAAPKGLVTASSQPAVAAALRDDAGANLTALVDADALRAEAGKPGLSSLALAQLAWLRLTVSPSGALRLLAARAASAGPARGSGRGALERFAPRKVSAALSRRLDLGRALADLLRAAAPKGAHEEEAKALRESILATLSPHLGNEVFWFSDGVELEEGRPVTRHVLGLRLKDPAQFGSAFAALEPALLAPPIAVEREGGRAVTCSGEKASLCFALADDVLLVSNRAGALRAALGAPAAGRGDEALRVPESAEVLFVDGPALASALGEAANALLGSPPEEAPGSHRRPEPLLSVLRALGSLEVVLRPAGATLLAGEVVAR